jgi:hypothetical protein
MKMKKLFVACSYHLTRLIVKETCEHPVFIFQTNCENIFRKAGPYETGSDL